MQVAGSIALPGRVWTGGNCTQDWTLTGPDGDASNAPRGRSIAEIAARLDRVGFATLGTDAPVEAPLAEPEGERELVWRPGYGWVSRPVEVPEFPIQEPGRIAGWAA